MDNEFPDPEDDFDLMHEDEYELLRELEASETQRTITKNVSQQQPTVTATNSRSQINNKKQDEIFSTTSSSRIENGEIPGIFSGIQNEQNKVKKFNENSRKRSVDEILESLGPINIGDNFLFEHREKKRPCWDRPEELMKLIVEKRKNLYNSNPENSHERIIQKNKINSISRKVPVHDFIAVTRNTDGERFYIKVSDRSCYVPKSYRSASGFLLKSFDKLKEEAEEILVKCAEKASLPSVETVNNANPSSELWVDKYRPKRYLELLSDENVNRSLLYWLKLWDKIVFDRDPTVRARKPETFSKFKSKFKKKEEDIPDHDSKGFPSQRIALLTGPPGLGKTTLAHVAAKHAGYNIVELNASDDRGPEAFREALLSSTQMRAVIDKDKRPNCLVLDEIDGAPAASIELLLKFIHGKLLPKGRSAKEKGQKENNGCRRPIICICNDLYTPSLRPLRSTALVISVPEISPSTLADRLQEIARREGLCVDTRLLVQLAERSACDVRACLGILQYTGGCPDMLRDLALGLKDMKKGLFDSWRELLHVPMDRKGPLSNSERAQRVIKIVYQGEADRLAQGIFHNYPENNKEKIVPVSKSLQWFEFYDEVNTLVMERQSWILMPYTTSAFVAWHLYMSTTQNPKISYPTATFENSQKLERNLSILNSTKKSCKLDIFTLVSDVLPYLPDLLCPRLRSVNVKLYFPKEKEDLERLVNTMLDFGLTFIQERKPEGGYDYHLDPNIWEIGVFPDCKVRRPLSYAVKQIVIQELETTRLQRAARMNGEVTESAKSEKKTVQLSTPWSKSTPVAAPVSAAVAAPVAATPSQSTSEGENVPNHLRQLNPVQIDPSTVDKKCRNFFRSFQLAGQEKLKEKRAKDKELGIEPSQKSAESEIEKASAKKTRDLFKSNVWYQYKEGYSNAVRRTVLMENLF